MNKRKYILLFLVVGIVIALLAYNYLYKDHRDISSEKAAFKVTTTEIVSEFNEDAEKATSKYLDKTIQITGKVKEIDSDSFLLDSDILCYADSTTISSLSKNLDVSVKGRFIGYDELLENIKIDQVSIIKN